VRLFNTGDKIVVQATCGVFDFDVEHGSAQKGFSPTKGR